ncbi:MAG: AraC family transcriptional regulator [Jatrophihabitantaceae bacterium]|nr:AraC family transcriptional regulator [Jatrophihabitantaceae bacterium]
MSPRNAERLLGASGLAAMSDAAEFSADDPDDFEAEVASLQLGVVRIDSVLTTGCVARRSAERIESAPSDTLQLLITRSGEVITTQHGRTAGVVPGGLVLLRSGAEFTSAFRPGQGGEDKMSIVQTTIPMSLLISRERAVNALTSTVLPPTPLVAGTTALLSTLADCGSAVGPAAVRFAEHAIVDLTLAIIADNDSSPLAPGTIEASTRLRIREFMVRRLRDHTMTPATIAAEFGISTRYLHRLFEGQAATVAAFVKDERLALAAAQVVDIAERRTSIASIAAHSGFHSINTFGRAFKERYGISPLQMRAENAAQPRSSIS